MNIQIARPEDCDQILPLLEGYRSFYGQEPDPVRSGRFLKERLQKQESIILFAQIDGKAVGFTQLYPSFSTVTLEPLYILNDLYVLPAQRGKGIGRALLLEAQDLCAAKGFKGLGLETARDNPAQMLYESLGWEKDSQCFHYFWKASEKSNP